jgi:hypothetical protein
VAVVLEVQLAVLEQQAQPTQAAVVAELILPITTAATAVQALSY